MNAAEQATNPEAATKIAAIVNLFKHQFPEVKVNLTPWTNDPDTQEWVDPNSIDMGFNLPAGQTLLQLRMHERRLIGIEAACFGPFGSQRWRFSTVGDWNFLGKTPPPPGFQQQLKQTCQDIFRLFDAPETQSPDPSADNDPF
ncbi:hypothetical protein [Acaryochloris sp. IP29b_bin.137]|uniref:hypothetical protein n=1 Tax=Acaryochloris sp. IP29b_bin.137 TaxID=2969217 RepID=UPI0026119C5A|nr:hypothetical protein [Acaryochloris sp. IP29b_bin.137]